MNEISIGNVDIRLDRLEESKEDTQKDVSLKRPKYHLIQQLQRSTVTCPWSSKKISCFALLGFYFPAYFNNAIVVYNGGLTTLRDVSAFIEAAAVSSIPSLAYIPLAMHRWNVISGQQQGQRREWRLCGKTKRKHCDFVPFMGSSLLCCCMVGFSLGVTVMANGRMAEAPLSWSDATPKRRWCSWDQATSPSTDTARSLLIHHTAANDILTNTHYQMCASIFMPFQ